jgi:plastocyanin
MRLSTSTIRAAGFAALLLFAMACGGGGGGPSEPTPPDNGGQATGGTVSGNTSKTVSVQNDLFSPANTTVAAGGTVTWSWNTCTSDPIYGGEACSPHNVTFDDGAHSATQDHGTFSRTFATAGTYSYHCTLHGTATTGMRGSITVQ